MHITQLCLQEFLQSVRDESETGRQTGRQREREILDVFSTLFHFSLTPRGFSKAFSKNNKQLRDGSNGSGSHFPAYPADYRLWYFSHYQSLRCVYFMRRRVNESFPLVLLFIYLFFCLSSSLFPCKAPQADSAIGLQTLYESLSEYVGAETRYWTHSAAHICSEPRRHTAGRLIYLWQIRGLRPPGKRVIGKKILLRRNL